MYLIFTRKFIFLYISIYFYPFILSAQNSNTAYNNIVSNVYDSITYSVIIGNRPLFQYAAGQLIRLHDSILTYIKSELKDMEVKIKTIPAYNHEAYIKCTIRVGGFKCYNDALPLKNKLVSDGYITSFIHGCQCQAEGVATQSLRKITAIPCNEMEQLQNEDDEDTFLFPWDSIWFKIRMGLYDDNIPDDMWTYIRENMNNNVNYVFNIIKFKNESWMVNLNYRGGFNCYEDAIPLLKKINSEIYSDAKIVAYYCFSEIDVEVAKKIKENKCR